jgi:hypothetical protein
VASADALRALVAVLVAEQERRRKAQFGGRDPHEWLSDELEQMARRLLGAPRPGDAAMMARLTALARAKDDAGLEAARAKYDLAPMEVVAWLIAARDGEMALDVLGRYVGGIRG